MSEDFTRDEINEKTVIIHRPDAGKYGALPVPERMKAAFLDAFRAIRQSYEDAPRSSYVLFVVGEHGQTIYREFLPLQGERFVDRIAGRHLQCTVRLPGPPSVSLRHLLLRFHLQPGRGQDPVFKVLDLATPSGFITVDGQQTFGMSGIGHGAFYLDGNHFFLLFRDRMQFPQNPLEAWKAILPVDAPELIPDALRVQNAPFSEKQIKPRLAPLQNDSVQKNEDSSRGKTFFGKSSIWIIGGPQYLPAAAGLGEEPSHPQGGGGGGRRLMLLVQSADRTIDVRIAVQAEQLRRGILVGRYDRCNLGPAHFQFAHDISRVHLLLIEDEGHFFAIDTDSTGGTRVDGEPISTLELDGITRLQLAGSLSITWKPV